MTPIPFRTISIFCFWNVLLLFFLHHTCCIWYCNKNYQIHQHIEWLQPQWRRGILRITNNIKKKLCNWQSERCFYLLKFEFGIRLYCDFIISILDYTNYLWSVATTIGSTAAVAVIRLLQNCLFMSLCMNVSTCQWYVCQWDKTIRHQ